MNGAVAAISIDTVRVLDVHALSRYCQGCNALKYKVEDNNKYLDLIDKHVCTENHSGSAPVVEIAGVQAIFSRSITKHNLRYTDFYGGDSKSQKSIEDIYPDTKVIKRKCIGHVQKRVRSRLRKLRKKVSGLGGADKLNDGIIHRLQNYYGMAIGNLDAMKYATAVGFFHIGSSKANNYHTHCPDGGNSWCRFKADQAIGTDTYIPRPGLLAEVTKHVKQYF